MGISGTWVEKFSEGNLASCVDIPANAVYPHCFFDIVAATEKTVRLKCHRRGDEIEFEIVRRNGREFAFIEQSSPYETWMGKEPTRFRIVPMKGERI